jgi:WD40 repeat protein
MAQSSLTPQPFRQTAQAYPAGCVVVIYQVCEPRLPPPFPLILRTSECSSCQPRRNRQFRYFRTGKTVSCLVFSRNGTLLAVGEKGHQPSVVVWSLSTGLVVAELKGGHKFGVSCVSFSPRGHMIVSAGFKYDRTLQVWDLDAAMAKYTQQMGTPDPLDPSRSTAAQATERIAWAKVSQKVRSIDFAPDGTYFVTCGDRHVKFWPLSESGDLPPCATPDKASDLEESGRDSEPNLLQGHPASILEALRGSTFMDVACYTPPNSKDTSICCITANAVLCVFSKTRVMEQWLNLEATSAYGLSVWGNLLCVGCSDGLIRLFGAGRLQYIATLPKPPPIGGANVTSTAELLPPPLDREVSYPAVVGVRLSPSGTKVVAVYSDRSFFIWDITDPHTVGKYRSFLNHGACIWDVQCIPHSCAELPLNSIVTCSADNTVRIWDVGGLDGATSPSPKAEKRWSNIYSKMLLRIIYADSPDGPKALSGPRGAATGDDTAQDMPHSSSLSDSIPDTEIPPMPDWLTAPRSLAAHPDGLQLACGDKQGNVKVFGLDTMMLRHTQAAHDGEVLSLSYSPAMVADSGSSDSAAWRALKPHDCSTQNRTSMPDFDLLSCAHVLLASASRDRLVHIFDASQQQQQQQQRDLVHPLKYPLIQTLDNHSSSVTAIKFAKDGKKLASAGGDKMLVLSHVQGRQIVRFKSISVPQGTIYGMDVDPTNKYMVTAGQDKKLNVWSLVNGRHARAYKPDGSGGGEMYKVDMDPAGIYAATCSFDKWIRLFDFYSGRCLAKVTGHSELVTGVRFTLDGRRLISIGGDGCIFVWRLSADLQQAMQDRLSEMYPDSHPVEGRRDFGTTGLDGACLPGVVARSKAKEEAKARLKLRPSQLPAWALTVKSSTELEEGIPALNSPNPQGHTAAGAAELQVGGQVARPLSRWAQRREKAEALPWEKEDVVHPVNSSGPSAYVDTFEDGDGVVMVPSDDEREERGPQEGDSALAHAQEIPNGEMADREGTAEIRSALSPQREAEMVHQAELMSPPADSLAGLKRIDQEEDEGGQGEEEEEEDDEPMFFSQTNVAEGGTLLTLQAAPASGVLENVTADGVDNDDDDDDGSAVEAAEAKAQKYTADYEKQAKVLGGSEVGAGAAIAVASLDALPAAAEQAPFMMVPEELRQSHSSTYFQNPQMGGTDSGLDVASQGSGDGSSGDRLVIDREAINMREKRKEMEVRRTLSFDHLSIC